MSNLSLRRSFFAIAMAASAALVSLAASGTAHAADGKTYPATICQHWNADEAPPASQLDISQFGRLINRANERMGVVCPIMRDSQQHKIEEIRVFARATNCPGVSRNNTCPGPTTRCNLRVMNMTGDITRSQSQKTLVRFDNGGAATAWLTTRWNNVSVPSFPQGAELHNGSMFVVFCEIGVKEELTGFYVQEGGG